MGHEDQYLEHAGVKGMKWGVRKKHLEPSDDHKRAQAIGKKPIQSLSDTDLKSLNKRRQLEVDYARLNPSRVARGKNAIRDLTTTLGLGVALYTTLTSPAAKWALNAGKTAIQKYAQVPISTSSAPSLFDRR